MMFYKRAYLVYVELLQKFESKVDGNGIDTCSQRVRDYREVCELMEGQ